MTLGLSRSSSTFTDVRQIHSHVIVMFLSDTDARCDVIYIRRIAKRARNTIALPRFATFDTQNVATVVGATSSEGAFYLISVSRQLYTSYARRCSVPRRRSINISTTTTTSSSSSSNSKQWRNAPRSLRRRDDQSFVCTIHDEQTIATTGRRKRRRQNHRARRV